MENDFFLIYKNPYLSLHSMLMSEVIGIFKYGRKIYHIHILIYHGLFTAYLMKKIQNAARSEKKIMCPRLTIFLIFHKTYYHFLKNKLSNLILPGPLLII